MKITLHIAGIISAIVWFDCILFQDDMVIHIFEFPL